MRNKRADLCVASSGPVVSHSPLNTALTPMPPPFHVKRLREPMQFPSGTLSVPQMYNPVKRRPEPVPEFRHTPNSVDRIRSADSVSTESGSTSALFLTARIEALTIERARLYSKLRSLSAVLQKLQSQRFGSMMGGLHAVRAAASFSLNSSSSSFPQLDPEFLRKSIWTPEQIFLPYSPDTLFEQDSVLILHEHPNSSSPERYTESSPISKYSRKLLLATEKKFNSFEDQARLRFSRDLLAYFQGDSLNLSVGQHAQLSVYLGVIIYANSEFLQLMKEPAVTFNSFYALTIVGECCWSKY